jgi:aspartyl aminopeptidase
MVAAHTDSPCLRVKPVSKKVSEKFLQVMKYVFVCTLLSTYLVIKVSASTYGGGLWRTWFDRDLSVAGQVIIQRGQCIYHKLIDVERPVLFIPNLAIHLEKDRSKFEFNTEVRF